ncbi:MAG: PIN domain-containing protein [Candidatus Baltobacteraceae bacterium]
MALPIALDANVVVYALDPYSGHRHRRARAVLQAAGRVSLRLPLQAVHETYAALTRKGQWAPARARDALRELMEYVPVIHTTAELTLTALDLAVEHALSHWDALIVTTAAGGGCGKLLTEDLQDGRRFAPPHVSRALQIVDPFAEVNLPLLASLGLAPPS